ncbi:MAG TPA: hypothetical protein VL486_03905 [Verrucomicrobiae bacterium]|nr:hypothetical protein [Verrucomicrobiae bacterium]
MSFVDMVDFYLHFGDSLPESWQIVFAVCMGPLMMLYGFGFFLGSGIFAVFAWRKLSEDPYKSCALQPLVVPLLSITWLALQAVPFLRVPSGTPIRPMGWAFFTLLSACVLMVVSVIASFLAFRRGKNKFACAFAVVLSIAMLVVPSLSLCGVARLKGFLLEP